MARSADNAELLAQWGACPGGEGLGNGPSLAQVLDELGFSSAEEFVAWSATADDADLAVIIAQLAQLDG